jgi:hypothetical protein
MVRALVLINLELGSEEQISSKLEAFSGIKEVQGMFGHII